MRLTKEIRRVQRRLALQRFLACWAGAGLRRCWRAQRWFSRLGFTRWASSIGNGLPAFWRQGWSWPAVGLSSPVRRPCKPPWKSITVLDSVNASPAR